MTESRSDITAMLSQKLEEMVLPRFRLWGAEVKLNDSDLFANSTHKGRVDYMAFEPKDMSHSIRSVEAGTLHVFEVKSCMADFRSGHGLNRVGDVNWLVITSKLHEQMIEEHVDTSGWKRMVWEWCKPGEFSPSTPKYEPHDIVGRKLPISQAMWMILTASGRKYVR